MYKATVLQSCIHFDVIRSLFILTVLQTGCSGWVHLVELIDLLWLSSVGWLVTLSHSCGMKVITPGISHLSVSTWLQTMDGTSTVCVLRSGDISVSIYHDLTDLIDIQISVTNLLIQYIWGESMKGLTSSFIVERSLKFNWNQLTPFRLDW